MYSKFILMILIRSITIFIYGSNFGESGKNNGHYGIFWYETAERYKEG